ncbi:MAG: precorrin-2 C(20)-methyltransferase [Thermoguttaceae bacterium]|jgi:precorrin-2/cobalt-factor-2 C20-methyltransferase
MKLGTLFGLGVGPGDPEWITVKAVRIMAGCRHVCVPKARESHSSLALDIARRYLHPQATVHELPFPMSTDESVLLESWQQAARQVETILSGGEDCCFLTLGDPLLYSTYIYLLRALRGLCPEAEIVTVPGITAWSAAAAVARFPVGQAKQTVTIVPAADDLGPLSAALDRGGTVVLMKIGTRLAAVLDLLEAKGLLDRGVFVSHAGLPQQYVQSDLRRLRGLPQEAGYLSLLLVQGRGFRDLGI